MSVMRNFRDRLRTMSPAQAMELPLIPGPDPDKMKAIIGEREIQQFVPLNPIAFQTEPATNWR